MSRSADDAGADTPSRPPRWVRVFWSVVVLLVLGLVVAHLTGHGLGGHVHG